MPITAPRGTKDILPAASAAWRYVEEKARQLCRLYGYAEIRTPMFEHTELFQRGIGEGTDVVDKEMYTFQDRGERSLTLRPENTASVVRAYLQNKLYADTALVKLFYLGSMFRYDRPQAGRMREFHQFGVEAIGSASAAVDAEIILLAVNFLRALGLNDLSVSLNSVGCPNCRPAYRERLKDFFRDKLSEMCGDCRERFERNPLRLLDCKADADQPFMADAPKLADCLCDDCAGHFQQVQAYLKETGVNFQLDSRLVRGLDYYTKTAFEIKYAPLGAQSALVGGGRYDGLVAEIGGNPTPGIGFAIGLERVLLALEKQGLLPENKEPPTAFIVALGEAAELPAFRLLTELRTHGLAAQMDYAGRSLKAQMKQAAKSGAPYAIILGENEIASGEAVVKDLQSGEQEKIPWAQVAQRLAQVS